MDTETSPSSYYEINPTPELTETIGKFIISYQDVEQELPLGLSDAYQLLEHRKAFMMSLASPENEGTKFLSGAALAFRFLDFLLGRKVPPGALIRLFYAVHSEIMGRRDVHDFIRGLPDGSSTQKSILRTFMLLQAKLPFPLLSSPSALPRLATDPDTSILMAFGGQGAANGACVEELAELYSLYQPLVASLTVSLGAALHSLSRHPDTDSFYLGREIDVLEWLADPSSIPDKTFIASAAVSFPIIGLTGLLHYSIICKLLGKTPGEMADSLSGITGHSQGIVIAAAVAKSHSWESFFDEAKWAVELLFWMGYESQVAAPGSALTPAMVDDSITNGYGSPSYMLLVRGITRDHLERFMNTNNKHLRKNEQLHLSLINGPRDHVVAGPSRSLQGLITSLNQVRAADGADQSRIPYSKRKPVIMFQYLPISAPFHSPYLQAAAEEVKSHMAKSSGTATVSSLRIPVFHTKDGADLKKTYDPTTDVTGLLVDAVTTNVVDWPRTLRSEGKKNASHIITLGSARFSDMVHKTVDGHGVRVIDGVRIDAADTSIIGSKAELFTPSLSDLVVSTSSWSEKFKPRVAKYADGSYHVETRLNSVLRAPPIITAGMTPTTVPWDFVASVINAGYHIELAGGGYHNAAAFEEAIDKVAGSIPIGRSITCNLIYVDPRAIGYQIPLIRQLTRRGVPIEGLTIGAGVPSPEIAAEYIETLGIKHISFKPGSLRAIREVIEIAKKFPSFPIILQWTGGRGGGHHSCEDFHEPLLEMYSEIRRHENLYLVVGSGFGNGAGILPYLTGTWSLEFGRPAMPCDGVLLGSRMMVATDAHTSAAAKKLILKAPGVDSARWENSYLQPDVAGGVLTVTSEMGQPIHKLATRGVRLWKDLDDTIFSLPKAERKPALLKRKDEIIRRLDADYAKPWFGHNAIGEPVEVEDMSYTEIISRLVELMYVKHQQRWVNPSYLELVADFTTRSFERMSCCTLEASWFDDPQTLAEKITKICPDMAQQIVHPEDVRYFIQSCKKRGRKPVNFVVALDDDFEHWFKKDSLWQSEDIEAVIGQDPERVCILQSPVAVRHSTRDDQSAKDILNEIHGEITALMRGSPDLMAQPKVRRASTPAADPASANIVVDKTQGHIIFKATSPSDLPTQEAWIAHLQPYLSASTLALVREETVFESSSKRSRPNPFHRLFAPQQAYALVLDTTSKELRLRDEATGQTPVVISTSTQSPQRLRVQVTYKDASVPTGGSASLVLEWEYDERARQLVDVTPGRDAQVQEFYAQLWLSPGSAGREGKLRDVFSGGAFALTQKLQSRLHAVVSHAFVGAAATSPTDVLPLEAAVIAAWEAVVRPILIDDVQGDLMRLVHQSIGIEYVGNAEPLRVGEAVTSDSSIRSITVEASGKSIAVDARILREGQHVATVTSKFFIRGKFAQHETTFQDKEEADVELKVATNIDEAVLRDRSWLSLDNPSAPLLGKTLVFQVRTSSQWTNSNSSSAADLEIRGVVEEKLWNGSRKKIGTVAFAAAASHGNPVTEFLRRKGETTSSRVDLKNPGWSGNAEVSVVAPSHTHLYSKVSRDCNPIHGSAVFAEVAELPGPIMHGMYSMAVARRVVEDMVVPGEPERLRRFDAEFLDMVRPGDRLTVRNAHVAMKNGNMIFEVVARLEESDTEVLRAEAEIAQPSTAYIFTGQGSQSVGMGMALYDSCPVAKSVYDEMDAHIRELYGFSILKIIRENPTEITLHFRGREGQKILSNYLDLKTELPTEDGGRRVAPIIPGLSRASTSYTFSEARGLLYSTHFAQPAIILVEKATFEHIRARGLVQEGAMFAGHSLGEYGALSAMAPFVDFRDMLSTAFYRGLMMQFAIPRDENGQTGFSMMATNPGRVGKEFNDDALKALVKHISAASGSLLEIVNLNVEGDQYVCAGHVQNLSCLTNVLNAVATHKISPAAIEEFLAAPFPSSSETTFGTFIQEEISRSKALPLDVDIPRGKATIVLKGIDVPFHSARMRFWIPTFRNFFLAHVKPEDIRLDQLGGNFVPNVVGKPFSLDRDFIREAGQITQSAVLEGLAC
ncbi:sterigmatocystin biosynthesis fatty acid synthase subunit beta [Astrocystis sublimbata]|nr:sterigmatocystin biosynthesis fatty acid synthase subunit beta [Astrocystis sublimbata]